MKKHRRNIKRLSKRLNISLEDAIKRFYNNEKVDKNTIFSINKKRNKGISRTK